MVLFDSHTDHPGVIFDDCLTAEAASRLTGDNPIAFVTTLSSPRRCLLTLCLLDLACCPGGSVLLDHLDHFWVVKYLDLVGSLCASLTDLTDYWVE